MPSDDPLPPGDDIILGTLGSGPLATVDDHGVVHLPEGASTLRWWVVSEERVHVPEREPAARHRRVDDAPIAETAVRVPGGDVVGRWYAIAGSGSRPRLALEVTNHSAAPVAVAVVVGPGVVTIDREAVDLDGVTLHLSRRVAASEFGTLDQLAEAVAGAPTFAAMRRDRGHGAVVVPLPHTQPLRLAVGEPVTGDTPGPDQVAVGWSTQVDRGASLAHPDPGCRDDWEVLRRRVLVREHPDPVADAADRLRALLVLGWVMEASEATDILIAAMAPSGELRTSAEPAIVAAAAVAGLGSWSRSGVPVPSLEHLAGPTATAARRLGRRARRLQPAWRSHVASALESAAALMDLLDEPRAAAEMRDDGARFGRSEAGLSSGPGERLVALLEGIVAQRRDGIDLLASWRDTWNGQEIDVRDVATSWGTVSFSLRWHGARPALLWEIEPWEERPPTAPPRLRLPVIDTGFEAAEWRGEVLVGSLASSLGTPPVAAAAPPDLDGGFT
ncbi:MAG TPA: hypothetical protein VJM33_05485 [Microthrixaceae bacterium]|nr:hypothetical protein [Microthrixaceae bacterium]